ncbi:MAG: ankyrin repeat domain-containing protein [Candidatus Dependentiae bacterium]|nr:ankyrin repeat domain-containing protein [Candidatus Dependentiae bacterium]
MSDSSTEEKLSPNCAQEETKTSRLLDLIYDENIGEALKLLESCGPEDLTSQDTSPLIEAAARGLIDLFKPLINKGASINERVGEDKWTALHCAISHAPEELRVDVVKELLELGSDCNIPDADGDTAFMGACDPEYYSPELINVFFDQSVKIKPNLKNIDDSKVKPDIKNGVDWLDWSVVSTLLAEEKPIIGVVKLLLEKGIEPDEAFRKFTLPLCAYNTRKADKLLDLIYDENVGEALKLLESCGPKDLTNQDPSPLGEAAERGRIDLFKPLINKGANINEQVGSSKWTALHYAVAFAPKKLKVDVIKALLELGADPNITNDEGNTAFLEACDFYHTPELISTFFDKSAKIKPDLSKKNESGHTALFLILRHASPAIETVELLLKNGSDPNEVIGGLKPLEWIEKIKKEKIKKKEIGPYLKIMALIEEKKTADALKLLESCDPEDIANHNPSPLAEAAIKGLIDLFKPLINRGANINEQVGSPKWTALHYAVIFAPKKLKVDVVKALLELGGDPNIPDDDGNTAFLEACDFYYTPGLISTFFDKSAKIKPDLSKKNKFGWSALFCIWLRGWPASETLELLLKNGSDPDEIRDPFPLAEAAKRGLIVLFKPLINKGANINKQIGANKRTALYYAVAFAPKKLKADVVKALLELEADPNIPDENGNTAFLEAACIRYYTPELISAFFGKSAKIKPDLSKKNEFGWSALFCILRHSSPAIETVELLLKNGSDPNEVIEGLKPHEWLKQYGSPSIATNKIIECLASASLKLLSAVQKPDPQNKKIELEEKGKPDLSTLSKLEVKMKNWSQDDSLKFEQN